jgi:hypothetical protein
MSTELLYLRDAYLPTVEAQVTAVDGDRVTLDRTVFYPTGGARRATPSGTRWRATSRPSAPRCPGPSTGTGAIA